LSSNWRLSFFEIICTHFVLTSGVCAIKSICLYALNCVNFCLSLWFCVDMRWRTNLISLCIFLIIALSIFVCSRKRGISLAATNYHAKYVFFSTLLDDSCVSRNFLISVLYHKFIDFLFRQISGYMYFYVVRCVCVSFY